MLSIASCRSGYPGCRIAGAIAVPPEIGRHERNTREGVGLGFVITLLSKCSDPEQYLYSF